MILLSAKVFDNFSRYKVLETEITRMGPLSTIFIPVVEGVLGMIMNTDIHI